MVKRQDLLVNRSFKDVIDKSKSPNLCFLILGLLRFNQELAHSYIQGIYYDIHRDPDKGSRYYIRETLKYLQDEELIKKVGTHNADLDKGSEWEFTDKFHQIDSEDSRYYHSYSEMQSYVNGVNIEQGNYFKWYSDKLIDEGNFYDQWRNMLSKEHAEEFIPALADLEDQEFYYDYDRELIEYSIKRLNISADLDFKKRRPFKLRYFPTKTGRLNTKPYHYFNKELRKLIVPKEDPGLQRGCLFNLDFSAQEPRILASIIDNQRFSDLLNNAENTWKALIEYIDPSGDYFTTKDTFKNLFIKTLYNSNGYTYAQDISNNNYNISFDTIYGQIRETIKDIHTQIPEIETYRNELIQEYLDQGELVIKDGVKFQSETDHKGVLKRRILSNYNQAYGSAIIRRMITNSYKLRHCRIHNPVHDAAVYYVPDKTNYQQARDEATQLMNDSARQVLGNRIKMPVNEEWHR